MATAFSYSGTGLESAIQSGSGGIGTGSSITLEVDSVPSDVSQGDTVKVALGSASDWSGGNGETAYGDIGGAGANGGTNITLTDRGQEGTAASSWSEGDPVRVGVQGREDAGPHSSIVETFGAKPSTRLVAYDNFNYQDGSLDGNTLPSGQSYSVEDLGSGADILVGNRIAKGNQNGRALALITQPIEPTVATFYFTNFQASAASGRKVGFVIAWEDNNNYLWLDVQNQLAFYKVVSGTTSQLWKDNIDTDSRYKQISGFTQATPLGSIQFFNNAPGASSEQSVSDADVDSILSNSTKMGIFSEGGAAEGFAIYENISSWDDTIV
jgi:hypothetical protein